MGGVLRESSVPQTLLNPFITKTQESIGKAAHPVERKQAGPNLWKGIYRPHSPH